MENMHVIKKVKNDKLTDIRNTINETISGNGDCIISNVGYKSHK